MSHFNLHLGDMKEIRGLKSETYAPVYLTLPVRTHGKKLQVVSRRWEDFQAAPPVRKQELRGCKEPNYSNNHEFGRGFFSQPVDERSAQPTLWFQPYKTLSSQSVMQCPDLWCIKLNNFDSKYYLVLVYIIIISCKELLIWVAVLQISIILQRSM